MISTTELLLFTCSLAASSARVEEVASNSVAFYGTITVANISTLEKLLKAKRVNTLRISSPGGDEEAALIIADIVKKRAIKVIVDGECLSSCSQYILMAAASAQIESGSLVAFHHSAYAIHEWSSRYSSSDVRYRALQEGSRNLHDRTRDVLSSKPRLALLRSAFRAISPTCIAAPVPESRGQWRIWMRTSFWIPPRDKLERLNISTPSDWPRRRRDVAKYARSLGQFSFGEADDFAEVGKLTLCITEASGNQLSGAR